jgi:endonuclease/exonuclease/phosphatase family metal-dependent hydrolase
MSFNLRYGTADDGNHSWNHRRDLAARVIADFDADLIGTQESVGFQTDFLRQRFPGWTCLRRSRDPDANSGESVDIFFRNRRFTLIESGHFWLSDQPEIPGSRSWDSRYPRLVAWCSLIDHEAAGQPISFFNTHFDYQGSIARMESAKLLRQRLNTLASDHRIVVVGDFNCDEDDDPYRVLCFGAKQKTSPIAQLREAVPLVDSWRVVQPERVSDEGTRHDFLGHRAGPRIDWILHCRKYVTTDASIVPPPATLQAEPQFPSDHHPITAILRPV